MAPLQALLTPLTREFLGDLPAVVTEDPDIIAIQYCYAKETDLRRAKLEAVRAEQVPH
nr:hypothetical protein [Actinomycetota bacterium]